MVLVDEYDKPVLDVLDVNKDLEEEHRNILKGGSIRYSRERTSICSSCC